MIVNCQNFVSLEPFRSLANSDGQPQCRAKLAEVPISTVVLKSVHCSIAPQTPGSAVGSVLAESEDLADLRRSSPRLRGFGDSRADHPAAAARKPVGKRLGYASAMLGVAPRG